MSAPGGTSAALPVRGNSLVFPSIMKGFWETAIDLREWEDENLLIGVAKTHNYVVHAQRISSGALGWARSPLTSSLKSQKRNRKRFAMKRENMEYSSQLNDWLDCARNQWNDSQQKRSTQNLTWEGRPNWSRWGKCIPSHLSPTDDQVSVTCADSSYVTVVWMKP